MRWSTGSQWRGLCQGYSKQRIEKYHTNTFSRNCWFSEENAFSLILSFWKGLFNPWKLKFLSLNRQIFVSLSEAFWLVYRTGSQRHYCNSKIVQVLFVCNISLSSLGMIAYDIIPGWYHTVIWLGRVQWKMVDRTKYVLYIMQKI